MAIVMTSESILAELRREFRLLSDRAEIAGLLDRYLVTPDTDRFEDQWLRMLFTDDIVLDFGFARHDGLAGLAEFGHGFMSAYEKTQHVASNYLIDVDGDRANMRANVIATHVPKTATPERHVDIGGVYEIKLRRTKDGWRIAHLQMTVVWTASRPAQRD